MAMTINSHSASGRSRASGSSISASHNPNNAEAQYHMFSANPAASAVSVNNNNNFMVPSPGTNRAGIVSVGVGGIKMQMQARPSLGMPAQAPALAAHAQNAHLMGQLPGQSGPVNRRQKKNRDKFRVTFHLSPVRASELQRSHGITIDNPLPSSTVTGVSPQDPTCSMLVPLKGIDVLSNGRYRVQLNTFLNGRKKFSRNSTDLYEALWIFEIALLISDSPVMLSELQRIGNYNCLVSLGYLGFFGSPREYYLELGRHILLFYDTVDFFNEDLIALAIHNYDALKPPGIAAGTAQYLKPAHEQLQKFARWEDAVAAEAQLRRSAALAPSNSASSLPPLLDISALSPAASTTEVASLGGKCSASVHSVGLTTLATNDDSADESSFSAYPHHASAVGGGTGAGTTIPLAYNLSKTSTSGSTLSRFEDIMPLPWMAGFSLGRSLQEQQLSCLFCLRGLPVPSDLPRIFMVKEDRPHPPPSTSTTATTYTSSTSSDKQNNSAAATSVSIVAPTGTGANNASAATSTAYPSIPNNSAPVDADRIVLPTPAATALTSAVGLSGVQVV